jgi:hypothetical protein
MTGMTEPSWAPEACTLPEEERPLRTAEFAGLLARTARVPTRPAPGRLRLVFAPSPETARTLRDLVARESACCAFFTFTVTDRQGELVLDIAVPPGREPVLDGLAGLVTTGSDGG